MLQNIYQVMFASLKLSFASQKQIPLLFRYFWLNLGAVHPKIISALYFYFPLYFWEKYQCILLPGNSDYE